MKFWYVYTTQFYSALKKNEVKMYRKNDGLIVYLILSNVTQSQEDFLKGHVLSHMWNLANDICIGKQIYMWVQYNIKKRKQGRLTTFSLSSSSTPFSCPLSAPFPSSSPQTLPLPGFHELN